MTMHKILLAAALALPTAVWADLAFNAGAVTDYRYRGLSQSRLKPALQGGVDYAKGGFYLGAWASTIRWIDDAGGDAKVELDLYGGYKGELAQGLGYDVGLLSYQYPGHGLSPSPVTNEAYAALSWGPATLKYSHSLGNLFGFADSRHSQYLDLSATFELAGVSVTPHIGRQRVKNTPGASYTDVALTVSKDFSGWVLSAAVVDTDSDAYVAPNGRNLGKAGLVLGVKRNF